MEIEKPKMNVKLIKIRPQVYHLIFKTRYEMCSTMMRLQEFYESPYKNVKGKYFTLEEYMDTYAKDFGNFTYTEAWSGFNVPDVAIKNFFGLFKDNLLEKEKYLYNILINICDSKYYLIVTCEKTSDCINHE